MKKSKNLRVPVFAAVLAALSIVLVVIIFVIQLIQLLVLRKREEVYD